MDASRGEGALQIAGVHHTKLPVSDVEQSRDWYIRVLRFEQGIDFVEEGRLMGVALRVPHQDWSFALRRDPERAKALSGYDPLALAVATRRDLEAWMAHLDREGVGHTPIQQGHIGWVMGLFDPDGIELRLYTLERPGGT
jgi:catechol 2,3-dioxygenase-like lactoylglutathione lyase family enzyme